MAEVSGDEKSGQDGISGKTAIILLTLGGPDSLEAVQPFLFNLFNDPAIIRVPQPFRWGLAQFLSRRRAPFTRSLYTQMGGKSPLPEETQAQASALQAVLAEDAGDDADWECRTFVAMRYWHPFADQTVAEVVAYNPDRIILLPLYPHFSTTTIGSSMNDWRRAAAAAGLSVPTDIICCYWADERLIRAHAAAIAPVLRDVGEKGPVRLLLSAHGLPQKVIDDGDPYGWQIEQTAGLLIGMLKAEFGFDRIDWRTCYQSRIGPMQWLKPSTKDEVRRAGEDGVSVVLDPIAFVSEHSETRVELDIEYKELALECGVPIYKRIATLGTGRHFMSCLAGLVRDRLGADASGGVIDGCNACPASFGHCYRARRK